MQKMQKAIIADNVVFMNTCSASAIIYIYIKKKVAKFGLIQELISFQNQFLAKENTWGFQAGLLTRDWHRSSIYA